VKSTILGLAASGLLFGAFANSTEATETTKATREAVPAHGSPAPAYFKVAMAGRVRYADLDLRKPNDVATLRQRIRDTATEVCAELGERFPDSAPETATCASQAVARALPGFERAIAAAR
jgi:UrcA family protein